MPGSEPSTETRPVPGPRRPALQPNVILAEEFSKRFDGFSIGSNDLTQLTLALGRDSARVASSFDQRNDAVKALLHRAIEVCKKEGK